MKILYITQLLPYPQDAGGKVKTYSTLKALTHDHNVSMATFIQNTKESTSAALLKKELNLASVKTIFNPIVAERHRARQLLTMIKSLLTALPYTVYKFHHPLMRKHIYTLVSSHHFDCIWIDHASMIPYLPADYSGIKILETHNAEHVLYQRVAQEESRLKWKVFFALESIKYRMFLRRSLSPFDAVFSISLTDKKELLKLIGGAPGVKSRIILLPPAISEKFFHLKNQNDGKTILFVGLLTWYPNRLGIAWFLDKVFPLIKTRNPDAQCLIVGDYVKQKKFSNTPAVRFAGHVKDVTPYLQRASVFVIPLFSGSGVRIKMLEAMAAGIPVVSTTIGAEGIPVVDGTHVLIADDAKKFAANVSLFLQNKALRLTVAKNAKRLVNTQYTQNIINQIIRNRSGVGKGLSFRA